jgi:hypothetical protein
VASCSNASAIPGDSWADWQGYKVLSGDMYVRGVAPGGKVEVAALYDNLQSDVEGLRYREDSSPTFLVKYLTTQMHGINRRLTTKANSRLISSHQSQTL